MWWRIPGTLTYASEAVILVQECRNVYLDTTMCVIEDLLMLKKKVGAERLMYASDSLKSVALEQIKYRAADFEKEELECIFYKNAARVFHLKEYEDL